MSQDTPLREMAIPGTHDFVIDVVHSQFPSSEGVAVLDFGAGQGALSQRLHDLGYSMRACDYFPDNFRVSGIECAKSDETLSIPFEAESFDLVVAVEVVEHVDGHARFFDEVQRVLKPGGKLLFTTPNILSLKSRLLFLFTGYFYSFGSLDPEEFSPATQHISSYSIDRYQFILNRSGLKLITFLTDKHQSTSRFLLILWPLIRLVTALRYGSNPRAAEQNSLTALLGRKLVLISQKGAGHDTGL